MVDAAPIPPAPAANATPLQAKSKRAAKEPHGVEFGRELARRNGAGKDAKDSKDEIVFKSAAEHVGKTEKTKEKDEPTTVTQGPSLEEILAQFLGTHGASHQAKTLSEDKDGKDQPDESGHPAEPHRKIAAAKIKDPVASDKLETTSAGEDIQPPSTGTPTSPGQIANDLKDQPDRAPATVRKPEDEQAKDASKLKSNADNLAAANAPERSPEAPMSAVQTQSIQTSAQPPAEQILEHLRAPVQTLVQETPAAKPALKSIQFELRPEALGVVQVTLKLSGGKMEIEIAPRERETESLLRADAALVDQVVRAVTASGDVSSVTVNIAHRDPESGNPAGSWSAGQGGGSQQAGEGAGAGRGNSSSRKDEGSYQSHDRSEPTQAGSPPRASLSGPRVV